MRAPVMRFGVNSEDFYDARWGYIATNGQLVVPFKYHEAYPFSCGLARVFVKGLGYGYINRKGEEVVPCKYQEAEDFHDFTAKVKQYDRVMTTRGRSSKGNRKTEVRDLRFFVCCPVRRLI